MLQSCLQNQIKDLIQEDKTRIKAGRVPRYMVTRYTYGAHSTVRRYIHRFNDVHGHEKIPIPPKSIFRHEYEDLAVLEIMKGLWPGSKGGTSTQYSLRSR